MDKCYRVYDYGGEYEDKWEHNIGVCLSLDKAKELKNESIKAHTIDPPIPFTKYGEMLDILCDYELEHDVDFGEEYIEQMHKMFPQYSIEDLQKTDEAYFVGTDYVGTDIETIDFYN